MTPQKFGDGLAAKIDSDFAHRTLQGSFFNPATLLLVFLTTSLAADYSLPFWVFAAVLVLVNGCRVPLLLSKAARSTRGANRWRWAVLFTVFTSGALWGLLGASTSAAYGCQSRNGMLLILYLSAIAGAGVQVLVQSVRLAAVYLCFLTAPVALVSAFQGAQGIWIAVSIIFYFFYLINQTKRLHVQYWQQLRDNQELSLRARQDSLTGLPNRFAMREHTAEAISIARQEGASVALLYIDLDGFKQINDHFSHRIGDLFLCEVARRLSDCCVSSGTPARLGGDEFTVLLPVGTTADEASDLALRLQKKFQEPMVLEGHHVTASASIGLSMFPEDCRDDDELLRTADHAMYSAKAAGKGTHRVFRDLRRSPRFGSGDMARDIREGLERNEFAVHYQPQVNCDGELVGFEALLRWTHPTLGSVPPLDFIPVAEQSGLMLPLGLWILRRVCEQGVAWERQGYPPVPIAVNVSPVQLDHPAFVEKLLSILDETGYPSAQLTLEITESMLLSKQGYALPQLEQLRLLGVRIAIDDFGTGYSSLSRINALPIDELKIDRTFVAVIQKAGDRAPIVEAVLAMARSLNLNVVAEGIEGPEQYEILSRMGCEAFQGYYFGKAATADRAHHFRSRPPSIPVLSQAVGEPETVPAV